MVFEGLEWFTGPMPAIIAGISGRAFVRSQFALLGSGQESMQYGPANVCVKIQNAFDGRTDFICSAAETVWLHQDALPALQKAMSLNGFADRSCTFIWGLDHIAAEIRTEQVTHVRAVAADLRTPEDDRYLTILSYVVDRGGREFIEGLIKALSWLFTDEGVIASLAVSARRCDETGRGLPRMKVPTPPIRKTSTCPMLLLTPAPAVLI